MENGNGPPSERAWVTIRTRGWPTHTAVFIGLNRGREDGEPLNGQARLFLRSGDDENTEQPIQLQEGVDLIAQVQNGQWQSESMNLSVWSQAGYNKLVVECEGRKHLRSFDRQQTQPQNRQTQPKTVMELSDCELEKKDGGKSYDIALTGIVTRDNAPLRQTGLDFYYKGKIEPTCQLTPGIKTDGNGRFAFTFANKPAEGKRVKLEVQIQGDIRRSYEVDIPAAPEEKKPPTPEKLEAALFNSQPGRKKVRHTIVIKALDQYGQLINVGEVIWACGEQHGSADCASGSDVINVEVGSNADFRAYSTTHHINTAEPLKLFGPPAKKADKPATKLTKPRYSGKVDGTDPETMIYVVSFSALDEDGKGVTNAKVERMFDGNSAKISTDKKGSYKDSNVRVKGFDSKQTYTVSVPGASESVELFGPKKPETKPEEPLTLEVPQYCANADGSFTVTVRSKQGGSLKGNAKFTLTSTETLTATALNLVVFGNGNSFGLTTGKNGTLTFLLTFGNSVQVRVFFSLPNGFSTDELFVKLP